MAENVKFRGEGGSSLVLMCTQDKKVYRLMKKNSFVLIIDGSTETERAKMINQILEHQVAYVQNVIKPQILSQFIAEHKIVTLPDGFAETVESAIAADRPAFRTKIATKSNQQTIDPATRSALMLPDLCFVTDMETNRCLSDPARPTISVEIKPKKGFMPAIGDLPEESAIKYTVCKFCIHQRLKAKEGRWTKTSHYCPIDLYSGNRDRMKHALYALCETPQNNLKICVNGNEVYGKNAKGDLKIILKEFFGGSTANGCRKSLVLSEFLDLILDALLFVPLKANGTSCPNSPEYVPLKANGTVCPHSPECHCSCHHPKQNVLNGHHTPHRCSHSSYKSVDNENSSLPKYSILGQILAVQSLDQLDIESVYPLFLKVKDHLKDTEDRNKWNLYGPFTEEAWLKPCKEAVLKDDGSLQYAVDMVKRHNVSKTLQDCSLMVALQRLEGSDEHKGPCLTDLHGRRYKFSVSVIDLDYKPFDKVKKWHELELEMLKAYREKEAKQQTTS